MNMVLENYIPLLRNLLCLADEVCRRFREESHLGLAEKFLFAFVANATSTLRGILLLYENDLPLQAQSLVRTLFEINVTFHAFVRMMAEDIPSACERVLDSIMLGKLKQQRASEFGGLDLVPGAPSKEELEQIGREIASRYDPAELKKIEKHGFSGLSVEERSRQSGDEDTYNIVYRNFSRNIHSADFAELLGLNHPSLRNEFYEGLIISRDKTSCNLALGFTADIIQVVNDLAHLGFDSRLQELKSAREKAIKEISK